MKQSGTSSNSNSDPAVVSDFLQRSIKNPVRTQNFFYRFQQVKTQFLQEVKQMNQPVFKRVAAFISHCAAEIDSLPELLPTAQIISGLNFGDNELWISALVEHLKAQCTHCVVRLSERHYTSAGVMLRAIVQQLSDIQSNHDSDSQSSQTLETIGHTGKTVGRYVLRTRRSTGAGTNSSSFDLLPAGDTAQKMGAVLLMETLVSWYERYAALDPDPSGRKRCLPLIIVADDAEDLKGKPLSDLVKLCCHYRGCVPIVLVLSLSTAVGSSNVRAISERLHIGSFHLQNPTSAQYSLFQRLLNSSSSSYIGFECSSNVLHYLQEYFLVTSMSISELIQRFQFILWSFYAQKRTSDLFISPSECLLGHGDGDSVEASLDYCTRLADGMKPKHLKKFGELESVKAALRGAEGEDDAHLTQGKVSKWIHRLRMRVRLERWAAAAYVRMRDAANRISCATDQALEQMDVDAVVRSYPTDKDLQNIHLLSLNAPRKKTTSKSTSTLGSSDAGGVRASRSHRQLIKTVSGLTKEQVAVYVRCCQRALVHSDGATETREGGVWATERQELDRITTLLQSAVDEQETESNAKKSRLTSRVRSNWSALKKRHHLLKRSRNSDAQMIKAPAALIRAMTAFLNGFVIRHLSPLSAFPGYEAVYYKDEKKLKECFGENFHDNLQEPLTSPQKYGMASMQSKASGAGLVSRLQPAQTRAPPKKRRRKRRRKAQPLATTVSLADEVRRVNALQCPDVCTLFSEYHYCNQSLDLRRWLEDFAAKRAIEYVAPVSDDSPTVMANLSALLSAIRASPLLEGVVSDSDSDEESDSEDEKEEEIDGDEWVPVCMRAVLPQFLVEVEPVKNGLRRVIGIKDMHDLTKRLKGNALRVALSLEHIRFPDEYRPDAEADARHDPQSRSQPGADEDDGEIRAGHPTALQSCAARFVRAVADLKQMGFLRSEKKTKQVPHTVQRTIFEFSSIGWKAVAGQKK